MKTMKRLLMIVMGGALLLSLYGCIAILAGAAGGASTAVWLSGKMVQQVNAPYERTVDGAKTALKYMGLELTRESKAKDVDQIRSRYADGRKIWIDVRPVTATSSRIEVRVGLFGDKAASDSLLKKIVSYL